MTEEQLYWMVYIGVLSIRLHPRNDDASKEMYVQCDDASDWATCAALNAAQDYRRRKMQCRSAQD